MPLVTATLLLSFLANAVATPPSKPAYLYVKEVQTSSDNFVFVTRSIEDARYEPGVPFGAYPYFRFSGNPADLSIALNGEEYLRLPIASLRSEDERYNAQSGQRRTFPVHGFPRRELYKRVGEAGKGLSHFDNAKLDIFLDDELVRSFVVGYHPPEIYLTPRLHLARARVVLYIVLPVLAAGALIVAVILLRHARRKKLKKAT